MATRHQQQASADGMSTGQIAVAGGAALALLALVLPWAEISIGGGSLTGLDLATSDNANVLFSGAVTGGLALVAGAVALFRRWDSTAQSATLALGFVVAAVGVVHVVSPATALGIESSQSQLASQLVTPGLGIYATILGGLVILAGGLLGRFK